MKQTFRRSLFAAAALCGSPQWATTAPVGETFHLLDEPYFVSTAVYDDRGLPIAGAVVSMSSFDSTTPVVSSTDDQGQTDWRPCDLGGGGELILHDSLVHGGIALGLQEALGPIALDIPQGGEGTLLLSRSQPLAIPVSVENDTGKFRNILPDGILPHWRIGVGPKSTLQFKPSVAPLLHGDSVAQYMAYRGIPVSSDTYLRGTVLVTPAIQLGEEGFYLGIWNDGDLETEALVADVYNFTAVDQPGEARFAAVPVLHERNTLYLRITGKVERGQLAILVRSSAGGAGESFVAPDSPPESTLTDGDSESEETSYVGSQSTPTGATVAPPSLNLNTNCIPEKPGDPNGWSCTPPTANISREGYCAEAPVGTPEGCRTVCTKSKIWCRAAGGSPVSRSSKRVGKITLAKLLKGLAGAEIGQEITETDVWTPQGGEHGEGQCMQYFDTTLYCSTIWTYKVDRMGEHEGFLYTVVCGEQRSGPITECKEELSSQAICDRQP